MAPMKSLTHWLVRRYIPDYQKVHDQSVRSRYGIVGGWISILLNAVLFAVKGVLGLATGSLSLLADAVHTLSDVATSVVIVISFKVAGKPADEEHPFGHGRMEAVATLVVAVVLISVGVELGKGAFHRILNPRSFEASVLAMVIIALTILLKEVLGHVSREMGRMIQSSALEADFWHHRIDAISSVLVLMAFGGSRLGWHWMDGVMGLAVSAMILWTGWHIVRDGIDDLLGRPPEAAFVRAVKEVAVSFQGVEDVHDLIVHQYGQTMLMSLHVAMDESLSFREAHELGTAVGSAINKKFNADTTVHLDPVEKDETLDDVKKQLSDWVASRNYKVSCHDLGFMEEDGRKRLHIHLRAAESMAGSEMELIAQALSDEVAARWPGFSPVHLEVGASYLY